MSDRISRSLTVQYIGRSKDDAVIAIDTEDRIRAIAAEGRADDRVIAGPAGDLVLAAAADEAVGPGVAGERVIAAAGVDRVGILAAAHRIIAGTAADGIVAYSAICPHAGCEVSGWNEQQAILECSCHASHYNPRDAAAVIDGPTPRPLPALPLAVSDGKLVVAKTFTSRPGIVHS